MATSRNQFHADVEAATDAISDGPAVSILQKAQSTKLAELDQILQTTKELNDEAIRLGERKALGVTLSKLRTQVETIAQADMDLRSEVFTPDTVLLVF
jgi:hypothetical protein